MSSVDNRCDDRRAMAKFDLTTMFSIIWSFVDIDCSSLFRVIDCEFVHIRGHNLRLYKEQCNVNCRLNAFVCRNINVWNRLPAHVVNSDYRSI